MAQKTNLGPLGLPTPVRVIVAKAEAGPEPEPAAAATEHYPLAFIREDEPPLGVFEMARGPMGSVREIQLPHIFRQK
jgi:hypothetical protein